MRPISPTPPPTYSSSMDLHSSNIKSNILKAAKMLRRAGPSMPPQPHASRLPVLPKELHISFPLPLSKGYLTFRVQLNRHILQKPPLKSSCGSPSPTKALTSPLLVGADPSFPYPPSRVIACSPAPRSELAQSVFA